MKKVFENICVFLLYAALALVLIAAASFGIWYEWRKFMFFVGY